MAVGLPAGSPEAVDRRLFFSSYLGKAAGLEEGVGDHGHERVSVKADP